MYPVMSVLRRAAVTYVYVREELLVRAEEGLCIQLETPTNYLELAQSRWSSKPVDLVPMSELVVGAESSEAAAISLTREENRLAEAIRAAEAVYTLVLGPESEHLVDGVVTRRSRYAVVRGVYRASGSVGLKPVPAKNVRKSKYSRGGRQAIRLD